MIDLRELRVAFANREVLTGIDLRVGDGEIVAVVGANGSGKTTLLDAAGGFVPAVGIRRVEGRVGRGFQDDELFPSLTVRESISAAGGDDATLARFGLLGHADSWPHELSTGIRRVVEIALVTARQPDVLLLDEPSAGLAKPEVENLAAVIRRWRDETGGSVLLVEHDRSLVGAVADRVLELHNGRLVNGAPRSAAHPATAGPVEGPPELRLPPRREAPGAHLISTWRLARWGLREFAAGLLSVMVVGVLNRVMAVELGVSLILVSLIVGGYNLAAPLAVPLGHRSDRRPLFGRRRSGYIVAGAVVTGVAACFAPDTAYLIARSGTAPWAVAVGITLFGVMGVGMYGSGTAFFAFLADQCPAGERARAASIVYSELMLGVLAGVGLTSFVVDQATLGELRALFIVVGSAVVVLSTLAVWGSEPLVRREELGDAEPESGGLRSAVRALAGRAQARGFFLFLFLATAALFLQQTILEPFGGSVLGLSVGQSTGFNGVLILGVLAGMATGARSIAPRTGVFSLAALGLVVSAAGFAGLASGAAWSSAAIVWPALVLLGFGTGLFNVAGLTMMMGMSPPGAVGLAMGAWTLAHAMADGLATAGGGAVYGLARIFTGEEQTAFASVFALEGAVLLALLPLLARLRRADGARLHEPVVVPGEGQLAVGLEDAELHAP